VRGSFRTLPAENADLTTDSAFFTTPAGRHVLEENAEGLSSGNDSCQAAGGVDARLEPGSARAELEEASSCDCQVALAPIGIELPQAVL
jgi:hypothetical protein